MIKDTQQWMCKASTLTKQVRQIVPYFENKFWHHFELKISGKVIRCQKELLDFVKKYPVPVNQTLEQQILMQPETVLTKSLVRCLLKGNYQVQRIYKI